MTAKVLLKNITSYLNLIPFFWELIINDGLIFGFTDKGVNPGEGVGRAVLIEVLRKTRAPPTRQRCARALYGRRTRRITFRMLDQLTLWRSSLSDSRSSWRRRILSWKIQDTLSCVRKHFTSTALCRRGRYLQPGESTQVGAVLDVDVGGATAAAAVGVFGSLRHGGHCRWFVSRSAVGATLPVGHRSTSESGSGRRARKIVRPALPRPRAPAQSARPGPRPRRSPGRPAGWSSRIVLPPPRTPLSAFYRHARLDAVAVLFYLFCPKFGETLLVLNSVTVQQCSQHSAVISPVLRLVVNKWSRGRWGQVQAFPDGFLSVPGRRPRPTKCHQTSELNNELLVLFKLTPNSRRLLCLQTLIKSNFIGWSWKTRFWILEQF